jgi:hypothetical protein
MDQAERAAYADAHQATLGHASRSRARPAGVPDRAPSDGVQPRRRGRPPLPTPRGLTELTTEEAFVDAVAAGDVILKTDTAGPPKIHTQPALCSGITKEDFRSKVIIGSGKNGRYFRLTDPAAAKRRWPRVALCGICKRLDPGEAKALDAAISASNLDPER